MKITKITVHFDELLHLSKAIITGLTDLSDIFASLNGSLITCKTSKRDQNITYEFMSKCGGFEKSA